MITLKEEWLEEEKTERALELGGEGIVRMWLALKGYAARKNTGGFIPDEEIDRLRGAPKRRRRDLLKALVDCGLKRPDGSRGAGLVDQVEHGWQLHDYEDHAASQTDEDLRREKARAKKREQRHQKALELARLKAIEQAGHRRGHRRGQGGDIGGDTDVDNAGTSEGTSEGHSPAGGRAPAHAGAPAGSQPSPAQPVNQTPTKARAGFSLEELVSSDDELPDTWQPNDEHRAKAARFGLALDDEVEAFRAWCKRDRRVSGAWDSEFDLWLHRAQKFDRRRGGSPPLRRAGGTGQTNTGAVGPKDYR